MTHGDDEDARHNRKRINQIFRMLNLPDKDMPRMPREAAIQKCEKCQDWYRVIDGHKCKDAPGTV